MRCASCLAGLRGLGSQPAQTVLAGLAACGVGGGGVCVCVRVRVRVRARARARVQGAGRRRWLNQQSGGGCVEWPSATKALRFGQARRGTTA